MACLGFEHCEQLQHIYIFCSRFLDIFPHFVICIFHRLSVDHKFNVGSSDMCKIDRASKNGCQIAVITYNASEQLHPGT
jgi:hypothetical protein